jgi:hypothetical protein
LTLPALFGADDTDLGIACRYVKRDFVIPGREPIGNTIGPTKSHETILPELRTAIDVFANEHAGQGCRHGDRSSHAWWQKEPMECWLGLRARCPRKRDAK